jgi:hypothetical protein
MKKVIDDSNSSAGNNPNLYPIQEQASLEEIWEYIHCNCEDDCTCKKYGCVRHWKLKKQINFNDYRSAFLRTFVNKKFHSSIIRRMEYANQKINQYTRQRCLRNASKFERKIGGDPRLLCCA